MNTFQSSQALEFDFTELDEIYPALLNLRRPTLPVNAKITHNHLKPLERLAQELNVGDQALKNAYQLGTGYGDLAVVLLEPSDKADSHCFDAMFEASSALKAVDLSLRHAFAGQRDIRNTIVLDIRAFRSDLIRRRAMGASERFAADELAYTAFEEILCHLKPDVILACQCQTNTDEVRNRFARQVCSSIDKSTDITLLRLPGTQHDSVLVKNFHPMYLEYMFEDKAPNGSNNTIVAKAVMWEYLFDAGFIIASNALDGRRITGSGLYNLRASARNGPILIVTQGGPRMSYQWLDESDVASPELVETLEKLGISLENENERRVDRRLLSISQSRSESGSGFGDDDDDDNAVASKGYQKNDILKKLGPIPRLSK
ncbi:hypothetical protein BDV06DRAFT_227045 [Aspergillus oleicola]